MKPFLKLATVAEVQQEFRLAVPLSREKISLAMAEGRYLAADFFAPSDLPGFARSRVDGYAAIAEDLYGASETSPSLLETTGSITMGHPPAFRLERGQVAPILTGAMLPEGANCAVMIEHCRPGSDSQVEITKALAPGMNIVLANDDAVKDQLLLPAGTCLGPAQIGCLASFGIIEPEVFRKPLVAIISTGDEIVPADAKPQTAQMRDVNSWTLEAICKKSTSAPTRYGLVPDNPQLLKRTVNAALAKADLVIVSGGSSAGMRDFTLETFMSQPDARLICHGVAISPGKPFIAVQCGQKFLLGLPGHVAGAIICAYIFVSPLLKALQGNFDKPLLFPVRLTRSIASAQGRRDYIRCQIQEKDGQLLAKPILGASALLKSLLEANALVICPENLEGYAKGDQAMAMLL